MADRVERDDPVLQLKGAGRELWASLGGGDTVIAWLRSDTVIPPPWQDARAVTGSGREKTTAWLPDYLL